MANSVKSKWPLGLLTCRHLGRVGHRVLLRSARSILLRSFKERNVLFKNATFISNFWRLTKPKRTLRSFAFFKKNARSCLTLKKNATFFFAFFFRVKKELKCSFFEFFVTYETLKECCVPKKNVAFFLKKTGVLLKERMPNPAFRHAQLLWADVQIKT